MKENRYKEQFNRLNANQWAIGNTDYRSRIKKLKKLRKAVSITYKQRLRDAMFADFKKPQLEVDFSEIYPLVDEINHVTRHLRFWIKNQKVSTPLPLLGSSSYIKYEPKGVCLIISPWNFPVNLTFIPLVSAIAAGNVVILKPSEMTPHTSKVMADIIVDIFDENEIILIEGEVETAKELLELPFNHIFFTGSPTVGKKVMEAASRNLTTVTLELGGKSPCIIDRSANLESSAKKIMFGKFINAGQTCIAPDYILVEESIKEKFISQCLVILKEYYSKNPENSSSYAHLVNKKHLGRIKDLLDDANNKGAKSIMMDPDANFGQSNFMQPTLISSVNDEMKLMQEEIFGPLLPIKTYKKIDEVVDYVNTNEKPLALYIFSKRQQTIDYILDNTRAGTTCINHNLLQFLNNNLPFGGSNNSGIGKSHGIFGFKEFSNARSVLHQHTISSTNLLLPPYNDFKQKIVDLLIKWF